MATTLHRIDPTNSEYPPQRRAHASFPIIGKPPSLLLLRRKLAMFSMDCQLVRCWAVRQFEFAWPNQTALPTYPTISRIAPVARRTNQECLVANLRFVMGMAGGEPDSHPRGNRYHRNARKVTVTRLAGAVTPMLTRVLSDSSTLIAVPSPDVAFVGRFRRTCSTVPADATCRSSSSPHRTAGLPQRPDAPDENTASRIV